MSNIDECKLLAMILTASEPQIFEQKYSKEYQCLLLLFAHVVLIKRKREREANADLRRNQMIKMLQNTTRCCAVPSCGNTVFEII